MSKFSTKSSYFPRHVRKHDLPYHHCFYRRGLWWRPLPSTQRYRASLLFFMTFLLLLVLMLVLLFFKFVVHKRFMDKFTVVVVFLNFYNGRLQVNVSDRLNALLKGWEIAAVEKIVVRTWNETEPLQFIK